METQQSGHAPRSGPEVKNGRSSVKDGAPELFGLRVKLPPVTTSLEFNHSR